MSYLKSVLKTTTYDITGAAICGGLYVGSEKLFMKDPDIGLNKKTAIRFGEASGSHLGSELIANDLLPKLITLPQILKDYEQLALQPVLAGGLHVLIDMLLKEDMHQTSMYKFITQVGASVGANYAAQPIKKALGV